MIHVIHTPTGWKVCQDYPEKEPDYCTDECEDDHLGECSCLDQEHKYKEAVALSIANAVDIREEDWKIVDNEVYKEHGVPWEDKIWEHKPDHVYSLPELEIERAWQWFDDLTKEWNDCTGTVYQMFERSGAHKVRKLAHVFRKKEEPKMEESQEELWLEIESIIDKWWDDKNDLRSSAKMVEQDLASKFHLTRVKAEPKQTEP